MKKKKSVSNNIDNQELVNKVIDLCLWYQIEDSHRWLDIIDLQIKNCNMQLHFLEEEKPLWFQKKKLEEHNKKIEELESKIYKYYQDMNEEVELIQKMQNNISIKSDN